MRATTTTPAKPFLHHDRIIRGLALTCAAAVVYGLLTALGF
jgi:hypothetical protein